jgi:hypothetical protein
MAGRKSNCYQSSYAKALLAYPRKENKPTVRVTLQHHYSYGSIYSATLLRVGDYRLRDELECVKAGCKWELHGASRKICRTARAGRAPAVLRPHFDTLTARKYLERRFLMACSRRPSMLLPLLRATSRSAPTASVAVPATWTTQAFSFSPPRWSAAKTAFQD